MKSTFLRAALILVLLAALGAALLHACPELETWLHHITGWY
jgi:hypothetical protein